MNRIEPIGSDRNREILPIPRIARVDRNRDDHDEPQGSPRRRPGKEPGRDPQGPPPPPDDGRTHVDVSV